MPRWGMVIDLDRCTGCHVCVVACRVENNVPFAGPEETAKGRAIFWMEVRTFLEGEYLDVKARYMPTPACTVRSLPAPKSARRARRTKTTRGLWRRSTPAASAVATV